MNVQAATPEKRGLILFGSPHRQGHTARMVSQFCEACSADIAWDVWSCFDHPALPCDDCRRCYTRAGCAKPDLGDFYTLLEQADLLVIATPVYNLSYTAPLKALLDRTQRYWAARFVRGERPPIARPKRAVLLTTAEKDRQGGESVAAQLRPTLTVLNATLVASVHALTSDPVRDWAQKVSEASVCFEE